ncbi:Crp/Fnr family transcriptional regulator [Microbacterium sp. CH12i]|uniref:Crp/Fnr family transcriptional regulator n=1 Tax=Microbacterium sp. CH12i TaxID=1479651 RepID=UPI000460BC2F|nr:Crp/Fnr family transcriptional regulator [Microbacterium sp. CH12i]KDA06371.1 Crp/Fnr family transcriptional regulator [Microbacterium sp. CH12i]
MRILAQIPFFAGLSEDDLDSIDKRMVSLSWAEGDHLYSAGEPADHLYVVAAGQVKVVRSTRSGQDTIVDVLAPGELVGSLSIGRQAGYPETVAAMVTTCALRIETTAFREVLLEYPSVALRVLDDVTALLGSERSDAGQHTSSTVAQRVGMMLLHLADKFGRNGEDVDGVLIQLPLTRADLAGMIGSTPESVSRVMSRLRKEGAVDSGRRWTSILDRDKLAAIVASNK